LHHLFQQCSQQVLALPDGNPVITGTNVAYLLNLPIIKTTLRNEMDIAHELPDLSI
jgi:hypothetical protein